MILPMVLVTYLSIISLDILLFPQFSKINYFNLILELLLSSFILIPLFTIQKYRNNKFYWNLNIGFYLLFLSYFVDAIDQIFIHSIVFTVLLEKATLVTASILLFKGSKQWMKSFEKLALTDYLTQIPNRRYISKIVNQEISRCTKQCCVLSLAIIDIDYFKNINDQHGHRAGDEILKSFAKYISEYIDKNDELGRWGGEEFVVLMKDTNIDKANQIMEDLRLKISHHNFSNLQQKFTVSIGLSQWRHETDNFESLFIQADKALYIAKNSGRNKVEF
jgi:diguanylate cyclase (GGDEF)-like protein